MSLLAPLGLLGLISLPVIVAFYMLRLRREERTVSSTFLWQGIVRDVEANAPWQKLRRSLLLLIQLLLALLLVLAVTRPVAERPAGLAKDLVVVVDASASMGATDVFPDRLTAAKQAAIAALADLPSDGKVSVIAAAESARVVVNEARDKERAARAIESIELSTAASDLTDSLRLADALAARATGAEVLVVTDDAGNPTPLVRLDAPVRVIPVGDRGDNQAIAALAVRADPSGLERQLFVSIANLSESIATRRLQILADGLPVTARDLALEPRVRTQVVIDELPPGIRTIEARLTQPDDLAAQAGPPDLLPADDAAWAIVPDDRLRQVLLVGPGNVYLQNALTLLPNIELYGATPAEWAGLTGKDRFDLIVFDGYLPAELPEKPILAIAPPRTSDLGAVGGSVATPPVGEPPADEPLLRDVDLTRLHIARAQRMQTPTWARTVLPSDSETPLIYSGLRSGLPTTVVAFDLRQSDLPLQVAFPLLLSNVTGELLGLGDDATDPVTPATPVELALRPGVEALRVTLPDGTVREVTPGASGASSVSFVETRQLGVYRVEEVRAAGAGSGGAQGTVVPAAASPGGSPDASPLPVAVPEGPDRFAVDLLSVTESSIAPGDGSRLAALGTDPADGPVAAAGMARDDWWPPIVALILLVLLLEWALYERDGARRIWTSIKNLGRRDRAGATTGGRR